MYRKGLSILRKVSNSQQTEDSNKCEGVGKLGNPNLKMRYMAVPHVPTIKLIHSSSTRRYRKLTEFNKSVLNIENFFNIECVY